MRPLAAVQYRWSPRQRGGGGTNRGQIRQAWPQVRIILRGDSGFCRDELLSWCEAHGVDYVVGLAQNARLLREIAAASAQAASQYQQTGKRRGSLPSLSIRPKNSWSRARRVIAKAEHLEKGAQSTVRGHLAEPGRNGTFPAPLSLGGAELV